MVIYDSHVHLKHGDVAATEYSAEAIIQTMDAAGIEKSVVFAMSTTTRRSIEMAQEAIARFPGRLIPLSGRCCARRPSRKRGIIRASWPSSCPGRPRFGRPKDVLRARPGQLSWEPTGMPVPVLEMTCTGPQPRRIGVARQEFAVAGRQELDLLAALGKGPGSSEEAGGEGPDGDCPSG
jgi:hypothetical protein